MLIITRPHKRETETANASPLHVFVRLHSAQRADALAVSVKEMAKHKAMRWRMMEVTLYPGSLSLTWRPCCKEEHGGGEGGGAESGRSH